MLQARFETLVNMDKRVALVTGAGKGIGEAIALAFAGAGIPVALMARTESDLKRVAGSILAAGGVALPIVCDVTHPEQIAAAVERVERELGTVTILVNNAGAG